MCDPASTMKTPDLSRASFLSLHGMSFQLEFMEGMRAKAVFVFKTKTAEEAARLQKMDGEFTSGLARVEPLSYLREVAAVRGRLYEFLRHGSEV